MARSRTGKVVAALALTGLLASGVEASASAQDTTPSWPPDVTADTVVPVIPSSVSVTDASTWLENALTARAKLLTNLQQQVDSSKDVTNALQSTLDSLLTTDGNGIAALQVTAANATDLPTLQTAASAMVTNFRVYSLVQPEVTDLLQAETQLADAHKLEDLETSLEAAIAADQSTKAAGQLNTLKASYSRLLTKVDTEDNAIVSNLVSLSPSAFASGVNALSSVSVSLTTSQGELNQARKVLKSILADLAHPNAVNAQARAAALKLRKRALGV